MEPLLPVYARADLAFERGEGANLFDADGRRFLDFSSGIGVTALGHAHPHLVAALKAQAEKLWHTSNAVRIPEQERLGARLVAATFADTAFFTNSGTEAVECAIKMARRYHSARGAPERYRIVTFSGAFHGRTLAAIAAGGDPKKIEGFGPKVDGFDSVPFADRAALEDMLTDAHGAILIEPVQGEGGIRQVPEADLRYLRELCDARGMLLILDEVQCGVGRTGKFFAHEWAGVRPDILAAAKGLGGGFPVGVCLATEAAASGMTAGSHGSTFGGNPLAMAVANAVLDIVLADGFLDGVAETGAALRERLEELAARHHNAVEEVRGRGLMLGLRVRGEARALVSVLRRHGLLTVAASDNVVRLLPPLIIGRDEADQAVDILDRVLAAPEGRA
ncbi:MAG: aspartate aminotransferase family protein [Alphaproteobacteria bacterium]